MHTKGPWRIEKRKIVNSMFNVTLKDPAFILMKDIGSILRFGDYQDLEEEMEVIRKKYLEAEVPENANNYELISFNPKQTKLTLDEICTIFNLLTENTGSYNSFVKGSKGTILKGVAKEFKELGY